MQRVVLLGLALSEGERRVKWEGGKGSGSLKHIVFLDAAPRSGPTSNISSQQLASPKTGRACIARPRFRRIQRNNVRTRTDQPRSATMGADAAADGPLSDGGINAARDAEQAAATAALMARLAAKEEARKAEVERRRCVPRPRAQLGGHANRAALVPARQPTADAAPPATRARSPGSNALSAAAADAAAPRRPRRPAGWRSPSRAIRRSRSPPSWTATPPSRRRWRRGWRPRAAAPRPRCPPPSLPRRRWMR